MLSRFTVRAVAPIARVAAVSKTATRAVVAARQTVAARAPVATRAFTSASLRLSTPASDLDSTGAANIQPPRNNSLVITAAGPDRSGIVHDVTALLTSAGANVEESRMSLLGNEFAILLRVTVPDELNEAKLRSLLTAEFAEFAIGVRSTQSTPSFQSPVRILSFMVEGPDQPGIVQTLTKHFVTLKGSVRDLDTDCSNAPFAGYKIFRLKCIVAFPIDTDFESLEKSLHEFEDAYGFDVQVHEGIQNDVEDEVGEGEEGEEYPEDAEYDEPEPEPVRRALPGPQRRPGAGPQPPQAPPRQPLPRGPAGPVRGPVAPQRGPVAPPPRPGQPRGPAAPLPRGPVRR